MPRSNWRERREAYLRERGRITDLIREGYAAGDLQHWQVYCGGRREPQTPQANSGWSLWPQNRGRSKRFCEAAIRRQRATTAYAFASRIENPKKVHERSDSILEVTSSHSQSERQGNH